MKVGKPMPSPCQRRDTGKWLANGSITVHNDSERVSVDVLVHAGEFESKEEAVRNLCEKANLDFVMRWLNSGGAAQLHRTAK
ncbi:MAG: hypothetical protein WBP79_08515 [Candidatus Acidiferrales bacterium]